MLGSPTIIGIMGESAFLPVLKPLLLARLRQNLALLCSLIARSGSALSSAIAFNFTSDDWQQVLEFKFI